jgi:hypothetical protein
MRLEAGTIWKVPPRGPMDQFSSSLAWRARVWKRIRRRVARVFMERVRAG